MESPVQRRARDFGQSLSSSSALPTVLETPIFQSRYSGVCRQEEEISKKNSLPFHSESGAQGTFLRKKIIFIPSSGITSVTDKKNTEIHTSLTCRRGELTIGW